MTIVEILENLTEAHKLGQPYFIADVDIDKHPSNSPLEVWGIGYDGFAFTRDKKSIHLQVKPDRLSNPRLPEPKRYSTTEALELLYGVNCVRGFSAIGDSVSLAKVSGLIKITGDIIPRRFCELEWTEVKG